MKTSSLLHKVLSAILLMVSTLTMMAQQRRPIDSKHPMWIVHIDVWVKADPQKIIDLIPDDIKPYVCFNLSLSCSYDVAKGIHTRPQNAILTYKSWATVCQANNVWFTCQPASGGHTHILDDDLETFEYFFKHYPNFLGWNFAEQFWGFDIPGDKYSSNLDNRIALFAQLVEMSHKYGGLLTISYCGGTSHALNPLGMMKSNNDLLEACKKYPDAILWLFKYTTSSWWYNNESVVMGPFISGLANNYGVRYDECGWTSSMEYLYGKNNGKTYPTSLGIGTVMEQTGVNGGAVWDGPELIPTTDFKEVDATITADGYSQRNWETYPDFDNAWVDMFRKIIDGTLYIPTRKEVVNETKVIVVNDVTTGNEEDQFGGIKTIYDGLYKQNDPLNLDDGIGDNNQCFFKKTGRYRAIPVTLALNDDAAKQIPVVVQKSAYDSFWSSEDEKVDEFNKLYPEVCTGDLYVSRFKNQLIAYTPYTYLNSKTTAKGNIPLQYNTCDKMELTWGKLSSGVIREYADHIDFYLNNYRTDTMTLVTDQIIIYGATTEPTYTMTLRGEAKGNSTVSWDPATNTFTLDVNHLGPVDITINCSGNATGRRTDEANSKPLTVDLPKQPGEYKGTIIIEAEDMDNKDVLNCVTFPYEQYPEARGHSGNGFVDMGIDNVSSLRHDLNMTTSGHYTVSIRYTSDKNKGLLYATMTNANGKTNKKLIAEKTLTNEWKKIDFEIDLAEGVNTLLIKKMSSSSMYIDNVTYTPAGTPKEEFSITILETEHGKASTTITQATEGELIAIQVEPEPGYVLRKWDINRNNTIVRDDNTFVMPDDYVKIAPVFSVDAQDYAYYLDFMEVNGGSIPKGWRAEDGKGGEMHEYPYGYGSGPRIFDGFNAYQGKALYWRNSFADYGSQPEFPLKLAPGNYTLSFAMAAWKGKPAYKAQILNKHNGEMVAESPVYLAAPNANGNIFYEFNNFQSLKMTFNIKEEDDYVIRFETATGEWSEFLLFECNIKELHDTSEINLIESAGDKVESVYNPAGILIEPIQKGLNIVRHTDGTTHKIYVK